MGWFSRFSPRVFVETGTFKGDGIQRALDDGFDVVYSIELDTALFKHAHDRFQNDHRVCVIRGDSSRVLPALVIDEPAVFYLDAHWSGFGTETPLPLLSELRIIAKRPYKDVVVIDDMRLMGKKSISGEDGTDWPKAEFDFREATLEAISQACPGTQEMATDIDRLIIYR